jgi:hypothetical protein
MSKRTPGGKIHSEIIKRKNVDKHLRIATDCKDPHERSVHIQKAEKLIARYGFTPLNRTKIYV